MLLNIIVQYFRKTLSARICLWVLMSVTILLVTALVVMYRYAHNAIEKESLAKAEQMLNEKVLNIENMLHRVDVATTNMRWNVEQHLDDPDVMVKYAMQMVRNNPDIVGCAISFEPNYYPQKGELYTTYAFRPEPKSEEILMTHDPFIIQPTEYKDVPYVAVNWYFIPKKENTTCWVRPHAPNDTVNSNIVTCGMPIHDRQGNTVGVIASDISVTDFSSAILSTKPFPDSYCAMLGVQGTYIVYSDSTYLYHKMVREVVKDEPENVRAMVESMLAGEDGICSVNLFGKDSYVLYKSLNNKHWSACIVCPESDIFAASQRQHFYMVVIMLVGILLIVFFCFYFVNKELEPLNMLARSAKHITQGNYNTPIPSTSRKDEIGILQNNFGAMQTSLSRHIQQISQVSEELNARHEELGIVHARVKEADNIKMNLIHKVADKMIRPIKGIDGIVAELDERRADLQKSALQTMSEELMAHTKVITDLLDQMHDIPKQKKTQ